MADLPTRGAFVHLHYLAPHAPYDAPLEYYDPSDRDEELPDWDRLREMYRAATSRREVPPMAVRALERAYRANIRYADAGIGVLLETLRREGLYRESLVILTSDHGEAFNGHGYTSHNTTLYDDMTRIPLLMKFPRADAITPGRVRALTESIDLAPTILDYLGLPAPAHFEGDSLLALARGEFTSLAGPEVVTSTVDQSFHAIRLGPHKYIMGRDGSEELFDLERDPGERHDRIESDRALATSLRNMLTAIVERHSGKEPPAENTLRTDPAMVRLLEKLGYVDANASE